MRGAGVARERRDGPVAASVSLGWIATAAYTASCSPAHRTDQREDSRSVPTVTTRAIPAARAVATTAGTGRSIMSRWVWLSSAGLGSGAGGTGAVTTNRSA